MSVEDSTPREAVTPTGVGSELRTPELHDEMAAAGVRRIPMEEAKAIADRVFAEHAELFRKLAQ